MVRLAVDCMGGDRSPDVRLEACQRFLTVQPQAELLLVGLEEIVVPAAEKMERARAVVATEVVSMEDSVEVALRRKKDSSMRVAITQVRADAQTGVANADACVSAGNTGALMAVSRYVLKTMPGIDRPAIATVLPHRNGGFTTMLDLGANVDCLPEHLLQFALMGSALVGGLFGKDNPTVGLLNIGEEAIKGSEVVKQAAELLRQCAQQGGIQFYGNVEGDDIFKGVTDVVVCDGFVGNVALKTIEGLASMLSGMIKQEFTNSLYGKFAALVAMPVLNAFKKRADPRAYNGASLLGLRGLVFKSHGSADAYAFEQALHRAHGAVSNGLLERVRQRIDAGSHFLSTMPVAERDRPIDNSII